MTDSKRPAQLPSGGADLDRNEPWVEIERLQAQTRPENLDVVDKKAEAPWKLEVRSHYATASLSEQSKERFLASIQQSTVASRLLKNENSLLLLSKNKDFSFKNILNKLHNTGAGYALTASVAAVLTAGFLLFSETNRTDPSPGIAEFASQMIARPYPADFDLEGDSSGLKEALQEVFPQKELFLPELPREVLGDYKPSEGRFFMWSGEPGVSIQLQAANSKGLEASSQKPATIYIVKLSEKNRDDFPKKQTTKRLANKAGGKSRKIDVWRDENFGYAMVQTVAMSEP